jgi:hypothetical protein
MGYDLKGKMTMTTVERKLSLPDELAQDAQAAGLLAPESIEKLLREAIERRKKIDEFFATLDRLHAANIPPMTMEEIQAEVEAVRQAALENAARR